MFHRVSPEPLPLDLARHASAIAHAARAAPPKVTAAWGRDASTNAPYSKAKEAAADVAVTTSVPSEGTTSDPSLTAGYPN